ncbi:MCE family protein [Pseudonocardia spinosispora]|uniref:MCE family protein n=1 Tax=Pseudonocardia spinosispora TaxID=103441 RepID=UPI00041D2CC1|nr:MCE family protein [Pseudonocardia spinosispora]
MKPLREYSPFWLGVVTSVVIVVAVLLTIAIGTLDLGRSAYEAEFAQAAGIKVGDDVRVAGMPIGAVQSAGLEGDHVLVKFRVDRDVELGSGTTASIKLATLLGSRYLELIPDGPGELRDGRIPLAHTSVPYDLAKVLQTGTPILEDLDLNKVREATTALTKNLGGQGPQISAALDGLSRLSDVVIARKDQVSQLIDTTGAFTKEADQRSGQIFAIMGQSNHLLTALVQRREMIRGLLSNLAGVTDQLRKAIGENQDQFRPLLRNLDELTDLLKRNDENLDRAFEVIAPASRYLANASGNGPYFDLNLPYSIVPDNILCRLQLIKGCK